MNNRMKWVVGFLFTAAAFGQGAPGVPTAETPFDKAQIDAMNSQLKALIAQPFAYSDLKDLTLPDLGLAQMKWDMALMQRRERNDRTDHDYDAGTRALDARHYDEAISRFDTVIANKGARADGAMYWRAYALNRLGRRDDALKQIADLRQQFPNSPWVKDAQALEIEVKQSNGKPVAPADEANDDLKLMAINGLMNADPDRAIPLLDGLLKGPGSPQVKDRAMFVLTQNRSAQARTVLMQFARGAGNPDLQERAIRYIAMTGTPESRQELAGIYASTNDLNVKRTILHSLMNPQSADTLFEIVKNEKNADLRRDAIRQLAMFGTSAQAAQLYSAEQSPENKDEVINGLFARGDAKTLVDLARKESDTERKKYIVSRLSVMHSKDATDYLMELLK